jgi:Ca2+-binding RTX toxin-like protein
VGGSERACAQPTSRARRSSQVSRRTTSRALVGGDGCDGRTRSNDGRDRLEGGKGADRLRGGSRGDRLRGGAGNDDLRGGRGNDVSDAVDFQADQIRCGSGKDTAMIDEFDTQTGCESVSLAIP